MPIYGQEDLAGLLADTGVAWSKPAFGAQTFIGLFDTPDEALRFGNVAMESTMYELTVSSADVATTGTQNGDALTVDGAAYSVRDVLKLEDGALSRIALSKN